MIKNPKIQNTLRKMAADILDSFLPSDFISSRDYDQLSADAKALGIRPEGFNGRYSVEQLRSLKATRDMRKRYQAKHRGPVLRRPDPNAVLTPLSGTDGPVIKIKRKDGSIGYYPNPAYAREKANRARQQEMIEAHKAYLRYVHDTDKPVTAPQFLTSYILDNSKDKHLRRLAETNKIAQSPYYQTAIVENKEYPGYDWWRPREVWEDTKYHIKRTKDNPGQVAKEGLAAGNAVIVGGLTGVAQEVMDAATTVHHLLSPQSWKTGIGKNIYKSWLDNEDWMYNNVSKYFIPQTGNKAYDDNVRTLYGIANFGTQLVANPLGWAAGGASKGAKVGPWLTNAVKVYDNLDVGGSLAGMIYGATRPEITEQPMTPQNGAGELPNLGNSTSATDKVSDTGVKGTLSAIRNKSAATGGEAESGDDEYTAE